jgi:dTDP-4-dehydrorhamnose reductase
MNKFTLVTGSEGLVGSRFIEISEVKNKLHFPKQIEMDILNPAQVSAIIRSYDFDTIVNFAAYTNVGEAEKQKGRKDSECWQVNVEGVINLVNALNEKGGEFRFIQISTDMVFPGSSHNPGPYPENHPPVTDEAELSWYGYTKAQGEKVVLDTLGDRAAILRIIYPVRSRFDWKLDYLRKPLKLFDEGKLYPLFSDQKISITFIDDACKAVDRIITGGHSGMFHASSTDTTTPFELVSYMLEKSGRKPGAIKKTTISEFMRKTGGSSLRYPKFGGLKVEETQKKLDLRFGKWKEVVDTLVNQGLGKKSS